MVTGWMGTNANLGGGGGALLCGYLSWGMKWEMMVVVVVVVAPHSFSHSFPPLPYPHLSSLHEIVYRNPLGSAIWSSSSTNTI